MKKFAALLLTLVMLLTVAQAEQAPETQIDKALALIGTFASGDAELAASLLDENYIQHNLAYGTGEDAFITPLEGWPPPRPRPPSRTSAPLGRRLRLPADHLQLRRRWRAGRL